MSTINHLKTRSTVAMCIALLLLILPVLMPQPVYAAEQLYDFYNASGFDYFHPSSDNRVAQTFTATDSYDLTAVKLALMRAFSGGDNPCTISVILQATDSTGKPTGPALSSGTTDGNTLSKTSVEWRRISMSGYSIKKDTKYAIVVYNAPGSDSFHWFVEDNNPYAGGSAMESPDGGVNWNSSGFFDLNFEVWGTPPVKSTGSSSSGSESPTMSAPEYYQPSPADTMVTTAHAQPQQALVNQPVTVFGNMVNRGDEPGNYTATLKINGQVEEVKKGTLAGNTGKPLEFTVYRETPGVYEVDLNGQRTYFTIVGSSGKFSPDARLISIVVLVILIIASLSVVLVRRFS